jgi:molybdopterin synthase sulfur carrier subunit
MQIKVLFFGATASEVGQRQLELDLTGPTRAKDCFDDLLTIFPQLARHQLLFSRNQQYAEGEEFLEDGDELAIFTAVSGG